MKTSRISLLDRLLIACTSVLVVIFVAFAAQSDTTVPLRARLIELGKAMPYASTMDVEGNVDDILSHSPSNQEAEVMLMQAYFETGLGKVVLGDCRCKRPDGSVDNCPKASDRTIAKCSAYGVMQTVEPHKWVTGATAAKVIADRKLGYEVGLKVFRFAMSKCGGNVRSALGLYFSGVACGVAQEQVAYRCKRFGC